MGRGDGTGGKLGLADWPLLGNLCGFMLLFEKSQLFHELRILKSMPFNCNYCRIFSLITGVLVVARLVVVVSPVCMKVY